MPFEKRRRASHLRFPAKLVLRVARRRTRRRALPRGFEPLRRPGAMQNNANQRTQIVSPPESWDLLLVSFKRVTSVLPPRSFRRCRYRSCCTLTTGSCSGFSSTICFSTYIRVRSSSVRLRGAVATKCSRQTRRELLLLPKIHDLARDLREYYARDFAIRSNLPGRVFPRP